MVPNGTNSRVPSFLLVHAPHIEVVPSAGAGSFRLSGSDFVVRMIAVDQMIRQELFTEFTVSALSDQKWSIVYPSAKGTRMSGQHAYSTDF